MMKRPLSIVLLIIAVASLAGCGQTATKEFSQTSDGLTATLQTGPNPPVAMEPVTFMLTINDATGQAVEGAQVTYDLTMPEMTMPPNQLQAAEEGSGLYRTEGTFTMPGDWQVQTTVLYRDEEFKFTFNLSVN